VLLAAYAILGGLAGIYSVKQYRDRSAVLKAGGIIGAVNVFAAVAIVQLTSMTTGMNMLPVKASAGVAGGILAAMLASLLLPVLESLFQITTDIRLLELSNLDRPIMRRMAVEAPGTYHHSIVMGTLAEAAAEAIGANPLQARVASYYHDIGKLSKPAYFVENQAYIPNKHETLTPHMSCLVLASHVKEGLEIAEHLRLPGKIANAIPQHHGTRLMTYFFQKAKSDPRIQEQEVLESSFRYPGPKPQSKETAILMIVDAVEAASRTLSDPTPAQIQGMVKRLIDSIVADGQFDECEITLKDLDLISQSCLKVLCGIFHHRIDYPGYDFTTTDSDAATADTSIHSSIQ
jgi:putative nucleotidyltransferase with HDIG domain